MLRFCVFLAGGQEANGSNETVSHTERRTGDHHERAGADSRGRWEGVV